MTTPRGFFPSLQSSSPPARGTWFIFRGRQVLLDAEGAVPTSFLPADLGIHPVRSQLLGTLDGAPCFAAELAIDAPVPGLVSLSDLRQLYGRVPDPLMAIAARAVQLVDFERTHQFCGACGGPTRPHDRARSRVCVRSDCALELFPRISPAMIVAVERGSEVLLARSPHFPEGVYSTLAGFVDPGESLEGAVHREVSEEVSITVENLRYFTSQAWPFPHSLMLGFHADYKGGDIVVDPTEIEHASFFHVDALPRLFPGVIGIGNQLLADFCRRHGRPFPGH